MRAETSEALGWLGNLEFTQYQETTLDRAQQANPEGFRRLAAWSQEADSPMGALMTGAVRILKDTELIARAKGTASDTASEKRVRSALNYSQTALGLIPVEEQEDDLRDNFPWLGGELLGRCLLIGAAAWDAQEQDHARVAREANDRVVWRENLEVQKREERKREEEDRERRLETGQTAGVADVADVADTETAAVSGRPDEQAGGSAT